MAVSVARPTLRRSAVMVAVIVAVAATGLPSGRWVRPVYAQSAPDYAPMGVLDAESTTDIVTSTGTETLVPLTLHATLPVTSPPTRRCVRVIVTTRVETSQAPTTADMYLRGVNTTTGGSGSYSTFGASQFLGATGGPGATTVHVQGVTLLEAGAWEFKTSVKRTAGSGIARTGQTVGTAQSAVIEDLGGVNDASPVPQVCDGLRHRSP